VATKISLKKSDIFIKNKLDIVSLIKKNETIISMIGRKTVFIIPVKSKLPNTHVSF